MKRRLSYILLIFALITFNKGHAQEKILVQYFMHTTCPISQKYTLTIHEIAKKYQHKSIQFELIFLDIKKASQLKEIKNFLQKYQLNLPYKTYPNTDYATKMGVKVTPEVLVVSNDQIQYQGAIDDWFIDWGKNKKQPEQFYLINALNSMLSNQTVWIKKTNAIGCLIELKNKTN
jgi:thiol-disulfide isomerase/thioredoxin